ncbi:MAG: DUF899 domain-containing protein [Leptospirales bacterium]|jgi:predicted dithiol-disulfide oxidoreductase (DUF899 family)
MTPTKTATREEWLQARRDLLQKEKAHTREKDAISEARRALPWVELDQEYIFETAAGGEATLGDLFSKYSQLIVYHFMFGPDWEAGCKSCSFWADSFNGLAPHLNARDIAFVAVSRAPMSKIAPFKERMGWSFDWVSSAKNSFNADFHVGFDADQKNDRPLMYNFMEIQSAPMDEMHGTSVFARDDAGRLYHTYSMYGRGLDQTNAAYGYIDLTPKGRNEPPEGNPMAWVTHHDSY